MPARDSIHYEAVAEGLGKRQEREQGAGNAKMTWRNYARRHVRQHQDGFRVCRVQGLGNVKRFGFP